MSKNATIIDSEKGNNLSKSEDKIMVRYDKLWTILNERGMMKTELVKTAKISTNAMAKLGRNEDVRVQVLAKICKSLGCTLDDIVELE